MSSTSGEPRRPGALRPFVPLGVVLVAVSAVFVALVAAHPRADAGDDEQVARMTAGGCAYDRRHDEGRDHVDEPRYTVWPPAGGDHSPTPADPGSYAPSENPPLGEVVHALEHGRVAVWYDAALTPADRARVDDLYARYPDDVLLLPHESVGGAVVLTSWGRRLVCPAVDEAAARAFTETFRRRGPERFGPP